MGEAEGNWDGSWAVEVVADASNDWIGTAMRYPTYRSADAAGYTLAMGWTEVRVYRVVMTEDPVNVGRDGRLL